MDGNPERRVMQSAIFMEYVKGGSLKVIENFNLLYVTLDFALATFN